MSMAGKARGLGWVALALCGLLPACSGAEGNAEQPQTSAAVVAPAGALPLSAAPLELRRRALRHLSAIQSGGQDWADASLAPYVVPLYRPDVADVAYYEFSVVGADGAPSGYLIAATGEHDAPLPLVSEHGLAPSAKLRAQTQRSIARYYMFDVQSFAAESDGGELVAKLGDLPHKLVWRSDLQKLDRSAFQGFSERLPLASPNPAAPDSGALPSSVTESRPTAPFDVQDWSDWRELKAGFAAAYQPMFDLRAPGRQSAWQREQLLVERGEAIAVGEAQRIELGADAGAKVEVLGDGASAVEVLREQLASGGERLVLRAASSPTSPGAGVELRIHYADQRSETLRFGVYDTLQRHVAIEADAPNADSAVFSTPTGIVSLPTQSAGDVHVLTNPHPHNPKDNKVRITNSTWAVYAAADDLAEAKAEQAWLYQLGPHDADNPYRCDSGCGGAAWGLLLAWADLQAQDAKSPWAKRWGIYRDKAGEAPARDALAPTKMDANGRWFIGQLSLQLDATAFAGCRANDERYTAPNIMDDVAPWVHRRSPIGIHTTYDLLGQTNQDREDGVLDEIWNEDRPAIIGIGSYDHYALAFGAEFVDQQWVGPAGSGQSEVQRWRINDGNGGDATISPEAWFVGTIDPASSKAADK